LIDLNRGFVVVRNGNYYTTRAVT